MSKVPQQVRLNSPDRGRQPIFVTQAELFNWAVSITRKTQEGDPYHDAKSIYDEAVGAIAAFFDGTLGTFVDPMTGQTVDYPEVCTSTDVGDFLCDDFNSRMISWPLFSRAIYYTDDNDAEWYSVLTHWAGRIKRFCKFNGLKYTKLMQLSAIEYNPLADYWSKEKELQGSAPYATISNPSSGEYGNITSWTAATGKTEYKSESGPQNSTDGVQNKHFTTTYDDSSNSRLESYDQQLGKVESKQEIPQSATLRKKEIEGHASTPIQDVIEKEFDIAHLWDIFEGFMDELAKEIYLQVYWNP